MAGLITASAFGPATRFVRGGGFTAGTLVRGVRRRLRPGAGAGAGGEQIPAPGEGRRRGSDLELGAGLRHRPHTGRTGSGRTGRVPGGPGTDRAPIGRADRLRVPGARTRAAPGAGRHGRDWARLRRYSRAPPVIRATLIAALASTPSPPVSASVGGVY